MGRPHLRQRAAQSILRKRHGNLLLRLNHALATMQPLAETGHLLATELQQAYGLHNFLLATYTETLRTINSVTAMIEGRIQDGAHDAETDAILKQVIQYNNVCVIDHIGTTNDAWFVIPLRFGGSIVGIWAIGPAERIKRYHQLIRTCADVLATAIYMQAQD